MDGFDGRATRQRSDTDYLGNVYRPTIEELLTDPIAVLLRHRDGRSVTDTGSG